VTFQRVLAPHLERTRQRCRQSGEYLLIENTTLLDYSRHPATEGLGVIGDGGGRGFELHSALAMHIESWTLEQRPEGVVVGLFDQQCRRPQPAPPDETRRQRLSRLRKSQSWAAAIRSAGRPAEGSQWIYVADRESDIYEVLQLCRQHGVDFVIRACQDRRLAGAAGHLRMALNQTPVLAQSTVEVRARAGQGARTARVELRSVRVALDGPWRPGGWQSPLPDVGVVEVRETPVPAGVKQPLHWILLTTLFLHHPGASATRGGLLCDALVDRGISQGAQERSGRRSQPAGASPSFGILDRGAGGGGGAFAGGQTAGARPARIL
jgi:hypothetical protein